jgi:integrase
VADLWQRYAAEVVAVDNKPSTVVEKTRMWKSRIEPAIGTLKIKDVTGENVGEIVRAPLRYDHAGKIVSGKGEGGNLFRLLRHMFRKALAWNLRPRELGNPLESVTEPKCKPRERLLTDDEVAALLQELERSAAENVEHPRIVSVIKALVLTGARIMELLTLRWEDVRQGEKVLHLRDSKTGFSVRPISSEALRLILSVDRTPSSPYVFTAITEPTLPLSYDTVEKVFRRVAHRAGVANCTPHTLRHRFATMTANSVSNPRVGMKLTGHKSLAAYMGYVHAENEQARDLAEQLSAFMTKLMETTPAPETK